MKKILLQSTFVLLFGLASACAAETNSAPAAKAEPKKEIAKPDSKPAAAKEVAVVKTSEEIGRASCRERVLVAV